MMAEWYNDQQMTSTTVCKVWMPSEIKLKKPFELEVKHLQEPEVNPVDNELQLYESITKKNISLVSKNVI